MFSIKCFLGFHDWEIVDPTAEEYARYHTLYVHPAPDGFSYYVNAPRASAAPKDRACLRCHKKDPRFQQLLIRGVLVYKEEMAARAMRRMSGNQEEIAKSLRQLQAVQLLRTPNEPKNKEGQAPEEG